MRVRALELMQWCNEVMIMPVVMMRQSFGESVNDNEKVSKGDEEKNLSQRLPLMAMKN